MDKLIKALRVILVLIFVIWGVSWISVRSHFKELRDRNLIEKIVFDAGNLPSEIKQYLVKYNKPHQAIPIKDEDLIKIGEFPLDETVDDTIYLLYYSYLGGERGKVILQNIKNGKIVFYWDIPLKTILADQRNIKRKLKKDYLDRSLHMNHSGEIRNNISSIEISSPLILKDSSLLFQCGSLGYLYKVDKNSKIVWKSQKLVHHSIEQDDFGNIWTCSIDLENEKNNSLNYRDDAILCLSPEGTEKYFLSLTKLFKSNNLFNKLIASSIKKNNDPFHLNDVLPVKYSGKYWEKGDVFLSIRDISTIILYRPKNDSILLYKKGNWLAQHDINIINDTVISVFNNNLNNYSPNDVFYSNIAYFNLDKQSIYFKYDNIFKSSTEGRQSQLEKKGLLIEETNYGRFFILDSLEKIQGKFYIPYSLDSTKAMNPTWTRVYIKKDGQFVLSSNINSK